MMCTRGATDNQFLPMVSMPKTILLMCSSHLPWKGGSSPPQSDIYSGIAMRQQTLFTQLIFPPCNMPVGSLQAPAPMFHHSRFPYRRAPGTAAPHRSPTPASYSHPKFTFPSSLSPERSFRLVSQIRPPPVRADDDGMLPHRLLPLPPQSQVGKERALFVVVPLLPPLPGGGGAHFRA
jgi:hypothetical protein